MQRRHVGRVELLVVEQRVLVAVVERRREPRDGMVVAGPVQVHGQGVCSVRLPAVGELKRGELQAVIALGPERKDERQAPADMVLEVEAVLRELVEDHLRDVHEHVVLGVPRGPFQRQLLEAGTHHDARGRQVLPDQVVGRRREQLLGARVHLGHVQARGGDGERLRGRHVLRLRRDRDAEHGGADLQARDGHAHPEPLHAGGRANVHALLGIADSGGQPGLGGREHGGRGLCLQGPAEHPRELRSDRGERPTAGVERQSAQLARPVGIRPDAAPRQVLTGGVLVGHDQGKPRGRRLSVGGGQVRPRNLQVVGGGLRVLVAHQRADHVRGGLRDAVGVAVVADAALGPLVSEPEDVGRVVGLECVGRQVLRRGVAPGVDADIDAVAAPEVPLVEVVAVGGVFTTRCISSDRRVVASHSFAPTSSFDASQTGFPSRQEASAASATRGIFGTSGPAAGKSSGFT